MMCVFRHCDYSLEFCLSFIDYANHASILDFRSLFFFSLKRYENQVDLLSDTCSLGDLREKKKETRKI